MLTPETRDSSAVTFAAELEAGGHKSPRAVVKARDALARLQATRRATPDVAAAENAAAADLVARAEAGTLEAGDLADLAGGVGLSVVAAAADPHIGRAFARAERQLGAKVSAAVAAWITELVPGELRARYLEASKVIDELAPSLPETIDDAQALRSDLLREPWLRASDAAETMSRCLTVIGSARNVGLYPRPERDPADAFIMVCNPFVIDDSRLLTTSGWGTIRSTLPEHWTHRLLEVSRRGGAFWLPTTAEQDKAAAVWLDADRTEKARLAGEAA